MVESSFGNQLNNIVGWAIGKLFTQGELAQLSYNAFDHIAKVYKSATQEEIELSYPIGYSPSKSPLLHEYKYKKEELISKYAFLANSQLSINGIYQLVTIVEAMLGDVIRAVILKYPKKIGKKRKISSEMVLSASSIAEIHHHTINTILNELSYKSPKDFVEATKDLVSINLLECPAFHKYIEVKATRDIHTHNSGIANDIYCSKANSHARVKHGQRLPVDTIYFLESYEVCIQLTEWLEIKLHDIWPSSIHEAKKMKNQEKVEQIPQPDA